MLVMLSITLALSAVAVYAVAKVTRHLLERFALEPWAVLLWLGLAEWPREEPPARPRQVRAGAPDRPARRRRRSPHRRLGRPAGRRPAAPRPTA